jgi:outer membrane protein TolC
LRGNEEREAAGEILDARIRMLDLEIERLEDDIRIEAAKLGSSLAAAADKAEIARQKWSNAVRARELLAARVNAGLASRPALVEADLAIHHAYAAHLDADASHRAFEQLAGPVSSTRSGE